MEAACAPRPNSSPHMSSRIAHAAERGDRFFGSDRAGRYKFGPAGHAKYAEYAHDIAQAGRALHDKIGDILEFANIEAGRYPIALEAVELSDLRHSAQWKNRTRAALFRARSGQEPGFAEPGLAAADPRALRRVLTHLLRQSPPWLIPRQAGWCSLRCVSSRPASLTRVSDSGWGFSVPERAKAGSAFQRTSTGPAMSPAQDWVWPSPMELARRMGGTLCVIRLRDGVAAAPHRVPPLREN